MPSSDQFVHGRHAQGRAYVARKTGKSVARQFVE
jgi:hypothetical protein